MSKALLTFIGAVAIGTATISTALTWVLAITLAMSQSIPAGLAFGAAALTTLDLLFLAFMLVGIVLRKKHDTPYTRTDKNICKIGMIITATAALLTFALLLWLVFQPVDDQGVMSQHISTVILAEFAFWALSLIGSISFFAVNLVRQGRRSQSQTVSFEEVFKGHPETCEVTKHVAAVSYQFGGAHSQKSPPSSLSFSTFSSDSYPSTKSTPVLAHSSSMTTLLTHVAPFPAETYVLPVSAPDLTQYDHFASDVSNKVISSGKSALRISMRLSPIPGSRPVSGADLLDGPFPKQSILEEPAHRHSAVRSLSVGTLYSKSPTTEKPKAIRRRSNSVPSRRESHIHPLFRTNSPLPPPTPTLGTTVVTSPLSGQCTSARSVTQALPRSQLAGRTSMNSRHSGDFAPAGGLQQMTSNQVHASLEGPVRNLSI